MEEMTRGEVAERAGVGRETVRFYERRGVIPKPARSAGGYRLYTEDYVARLRFVQRAQELGFTLEEIKALFALRADPDATAAHVREQAATKRAEVERKIRDLERIRTVLDALVAGCDGRAPTSDCPILEAMQHETAFDAPCD